GVIGWAPRDESGHPVRYWPWLVKAEADAVGPGRDPYGPASLLAELPLSRGPERLAGFHLAADPADLHRLADDAGREDEVRTVEERHARGAEPRALGPQAILEHRSVQHR